MKKKILFLAFVLISVFIINNLVRSIYSLWGKQDLLDKAQKELENEKLKNQKLRGELSYVKTPEFIEKEARNKLFLVKLEEEVLVFPKDFLQGSPSAKTKTPQVPNWKQWLDLFF